MIFVEVFIRFIRYIVQCRHLVTASIQVPPTVICDDSKSSVSTATGTEDPASCLYWSLCVRCFSHDPAQTEGLARSQNTHKHSSTPPCLLSNPMPCLPAFSTGGASLWAACGCAPGSVLLLLKRGCGSLGANYLFRRHARGFIDKKY